VTSYLQRTKFRTQRIICQALSLVVASARTYNTACVYCLTIGLTECCDILF